MRTVLIIFVLITLAFAVDEAKPLLSEDQLASLKMRATAQKSSEFGAKGGKKGQPGSGINRAMIEEQKAVQAEELATASAAEVNHHFIFFIKQ